MAIAKQQAVLALMTIGLIGVGIVASQVTLATLNSREAATQRDALALCESRIADLKAQGIPIDFQSLQELYNSRTSPDDTAAWLNVFARVTPQAFESELNASTSQNADLLADVHQLVKAGKPVRFDINYATWLTDKNEFVADFLFGRLNIEYDERGSEPWLSSMGNHVEGFRALMRLLSSETREGITQSDPAKIQQSLKTQIGLLTIFRGEDLLVDCQVRCAMQSIIAANVKTVLESNVLAQEHVDELSNDLRSMTGINESWPRVVQYERAWLLAYLRGQQPLSYRSAVPGTKTRINTSGLDLLKFLDYMDRYEHVDWSSSKTALNSFIKIDHDLEHELSREPFRQYPYWWTWQRAICHWNDLAGDIADSLSKRNQAIMACQLRLYQMKNASLPDTLEQLVDIGFNPNDFLSAVDIPFGYERRNDIAYLWGPIQPGGGFPFTMYQKVPQITEDMHFYMVQQIERAVWSLKR